MRAFIFDVDGTLTPSRSEIDKEFAEWFLGYCSRNSVYLVTGSDYPKTVEQVGEDIVNAVNVAIIVLVVVCGKTVQKYFIMSLR
jgi:hydroxymethylpyrimidine pyrophosphatase-like HAD family hydrolase